MATFTDDFNRADSASLGANWTTIGNSHSIAGNRMAVPSTLTYVNVWATDAASADCFSRATVAVVAGTNVSLIVRCDGTDSNWYRLTYNGTNLQLSKRVAGTITSIGSAHTVTLVNGDILELRATGSAIKGYLNGVEVCSATDTALPGGSTQRKVGVRSFGNASLRYDDWSGGDVTAGGPWTVAVNQASETSTANTVTPSKKRAVAQATETSSAQALTPSKARSLGQATATDTAQPITPTKTRTLGQATETSVANAITRAAPGATIVPIGQASETSSANPITPSKTRGIGQASETATAQPLTGLKARTLGQASEAATALGMTGLKALGIGQATETSAAQPITPSGGAVAANARSGATVTATRTSTSTVTARRTSTATVTASATSTSTVSDG